MVTLLPFSVFDWWGKLFWRTWAHGYPFLFANLFSSLFSPMALNLLDNEQVACTLQKSTMIWITPSILWFFAFIAFMASSNGQWWSGGFIFLVLFIWFVVEMIRRIRYAGYVTNKRIILNYGLFLHEREIRFEQLEWVNVERYKAIFWHQIQVNGTGGTSTLFDYAGNHDKFKNSIYEAKEKLNMTQRSIQIPTVSENPVVA